MTMMSSYDMDMSCHDIVMSCHVMSCDVSAWWSRRDVIIIIIIIIVECWEGSAGGVSGVDRCLVGRCRSTHRRLRTNSSQVSCMPRAFLFFTLYRTVCVCVCVCVCVRRSVSVYFVCFLGFHIAYCWLSMMGWTRCDWSLIPLSSVLWHCWLGHLTRKTRPRWHIMCLVGR